MNCEEYTDLFSGHLDGQNSQAEEQALQAHLDVCPRCRALLNELEQTDRLVAEVPAPPENLTAAIMTKVRVKKRRKKPLYRYFLPAATLASAAILALAVFGAMNLPVFAAKSADDPGTNEAYGDFDADIAGIEFSQCSPGEDEESKDLTSESLKLSSANESSQSRMDYSASPVMVVWYEDEESPISGLTKLTTLPYASNRLFSSVLDSLLSPSAPMTENIQAALESTAASVDAYTFPYSRLDKIFGNLTDSYEVAVFYPVGIPDEDATCLLLAAQISE